MGPAGCSRWSPPGGPGPRGGRPPTHSRRDIIDAIRYVTHNGGVWRALPADFPPWKTVHDYHTRWAADGTVSRIHNAPRDQVRTAEGRHPDPSAALVDSQSVRAAESVTATDRGYDAGKKINGRKRHRHRHHRAAAGCPGHRRQCAGP